MNINYEDSEGTIEYEYMQLDHAYMMMEVTEGTPEYNTWRETWKAQNEIIRRMERAESN